jgi:hypothetical protein
MATQIKLRSDSVLNWASNNPILAQAEIGIELVTNKFKIGDGTSQWNSLSYASSSSTSNHNELLELQGGDSTSDEYYHLTQDERDKILGMPDILDQKTFTGDDNIVFLDFTRKSIRLDSAIDLILTLPIMTEDYDGSKLRLILVGTGTGTLLCQGDDTIWNELDTQLIGTTQYGSVDIEYVWAEKMFICRTQGSWGSE